MPARDQTAAPSVFISYAWEDDAFRAKVKALVDWLRGQGLAVVADVDIVKPPTLGWPIWMQHSVEDACVVLVVCSPKYKAHLEKRARADAGLAEAWQGAIITQELYATAQRNDKFYPIFPEPVNLADIPNLLKPWNSGFSFPTQQEKILALLRACLPDAAGPGNATWHEYTDQTQHTKPAADSAHPSQKAMQALEQTITQALAMPEAQHFRTVLCQILQLPPATALEQMIIKLDAQASLEKQMLFLQKALKDSAKLHPIKPNLQAEPHAVEKAGAALYMRAALRRVNLAAIKAGCPSQDGVTLVPAHSDVLIAILAAAQHGEIQPMRLQGQTSKAHGKAVGEYFLDCTDMPLYPLQEEAAFIHAVGRATDKRYGYDDVPKQEEIAERRLKVKGAIAYMNFVEQKNFRGIVNSGANLWLQDDEKLRELYRNLSLPFNRVVSDANEQMMVEEFLGVNLTTIEVLFVQFLEVLDEAKQ